MVSLRAQVLNLPQLKYMHSVILRRCLTTGNPGSVIVPQYGSSKITVFVWGKNIILDRVNLNKLLQIITKLRWSNKDNNN